MDLKIVEPPLDAAIDRGASHLHQPRKVIKRKKRHPFEDLVPPPPTRNSRPDVSTRKVYQLGQDLPLYPSRRFRAGK
ncbi:hypothetical protein LshimejAT787_1702490 [Lyophyllum shimeji]|uniref:Uncharacterized protein n=1 Tax=Lyophyllum shimeji TaxID=47721 RepID=A0A9P3UTX5_LYOSH|nr:hypothetical protein LshimejAT787_1702490 [Lyophyllum shimeji]